MSIVVRQELPTLCAHSYGFYLPHSHKEKYIGLPVLFRASRIRGYLNLGDRP